MKIGEHIRQGDVLVRRVKAIPSGAELVEPDVQGRNVLAYGEVTGHAHALPAMGTQLYRVPDNDNQFLRVIDGGVGLLHEEHGRIPLPPGNYEVVRQREFSYWDDEVRYVAD